MKCYILIIIILIIYLVFIPYKENFFNNHLCFGGTSNNTEIDKIKCCENKKGLIKYKCKSKSGEDLCKHVNCQILNLPNNNIGNLCESQDCNKFIDSYYIFIKNFFNKIKYMLI